MILCQIPVLASLLACAPPPFATGYVEGDYTRIAPIEAAQIADVKVVRGDRVKAGDLLVAMQDRDARIALTKAQAALAQARSDLADLKEGKRPEEINVLEATLASARAKADEADRQSARIAKLEARGAATTADRDDAATAAEVAHAAVAEASANLAVARLPARPQEIAAAEETVKGARAARDQAEWALEQRSLTAPAAGRIDDVIRTDGEIAGPSAPVLSLLADGAVKLRLYVPETEVAQIAPGSLLDVGCDGCAAGMQARVSYVADGPEFTPPVIYSLQNRQKLVYLIEARPVTESGLKPGQIVSVTLPGAAK